VRRKATRRAAARQLRAGVPVFVPRDGVLGVTVTEVPPEPGEDPFRSRAHLHDDLLIVSATFTRYIAVRSSAR
jgi:hypothetical protein